MSGHRFHSPLTRVMLPVDVAQFNFIKRRFNSVSQKKRAYTSDLMLGELGLFRKKLLRWYDQHRRELPWRVPRNKGASGRALGDVRIDPYHVLVSEAMLQQTQVATVIPYFHRFLERFPTIASLAAADEQDVLRLWQGLGYYSRARNLRAAARRVVAEHDGELPQTVKQLLELPGVGRYTAGAIASIAFDRRAPILDGNVIRVLCRTARIESDPREKETQEQLWVRAEEVLPAKRCGDFNSALMELGATVCTPRAPKCLLCPVRDHCRAQAAGVQEQIPRARQPRQTPLLRRNVYCIRRGDHYLVEQRPSKGRWAGMWQFVTLDAQQPPRSAATHLRIKLSPPRHIGTVNHALTHRRYTFDVYACTVKHNGSDPSPRRWTTLDRLCDYPLPRPHLKVAELLRHLS